MNDKVAERALVVFSGGQDSTTCLYAAVHEYGRENVAALTINYGQRHGIEIDAAEKIASLVDVPHEIVFVGSGILKGTSPLTNRDEKLEQYENYEKLPGGLEKTFVPARNMLFMTIASNRAYIGGFERIVMGLSQEDYGGYPDCRIPFVDAFADAMQKGLEKEIWFWMPVINMTKAETVQFALTMPGCYCGLAFSHTSYDGQYPPTGHDHATLLRQKGFAEANVPDPLVVRAFWEGKMALPETDNYKNYKPIIERQTGEMYERLATLEARIVDLCQVPGRV